MTQPRPCPVCNVVLAFPAESAGHADGCGYPRSHNAQVELLNRAVRNFGNELVRASNEMLRRFRGRS